MNKIIKHGSSTCKRIKRKEILKVKATNQRRIGGLHVKYLTYEVCLFLFLKTK